MAEAEVGVAPQGARQDFADPGLTAPDVAAPTVAVWFAALALWIVATTLALSDLSRWWLAFTIPAHIVVSYLMFTVLHDSIHHAVGRKHWINQLFGRLSMPFVALWGTYPVVGYIHIEHHRNTNESPLSDPDAWAHTGPSWQLAFRWLTIDAWYAGFYLRRVRRRPGTERAGLLVNQIVLVTALGAALAFGYGWELLLIYLIPQRICLAILAWWFDWLPHHGLEMTAKTNAFRASRVRVGWERMMNPLLMYENYHVVHHIHPSIPFYLWMKAWKYAETDYLDREVPIVTAGGREITASQYRAWRSAETTSVEPELTGEPVPILATVVISRGGATEQTTQMGDESLLEAALRAGIDVPYSCFGGRCAECKARLLLGDVHTEGDAQDAREDWILTCSSWPTSDVVHIEYDR